MIGLEGTFLTKCTFLAREYSTLRCGANNAPCGAGGPFIEGIRSDGYDAKSRIRLFEAPVRGKVFLVFWRRIASYFVPELSLPGLRRTFHWQNVHCSTIQQNVPIWKGPIPGPAIPLVHLNLNIFKYFDPLFS